MPCLADEHTKQGNLDDLAPMNLESKELLPFVSSCMRNVTITAEKNIRHDKGPSWLLETNGKGQKASVHK